jgi:hypothetical protein
VFLIADPESEEFIPLVKKAFKKWSDGMKQFTGRQDLWNFNIISSKEAADSFEKLPRGQNDIVVNLVGDPEETEAFLYGDPIEGKEHRDDPFGPSIIHVYTSNKAGPKDPELLYNTLLHEAGHSFKLKHPTVNGACVHVMCDGKTADKASFSAEPGPDEFAAVAHVHLNDGWKGVTRIISTDNGYHDFGNDVRKPVISSLGAGGYFDDNCESDNGAMIPCSEAVEVRDGYTSNPNIIGEPPEWCKNLKDSCANYVVCEDGNRCRYEDEEGYIVEEEPADELLAVGLGLAQQPSPEIIPEPLALDEGTGELGAEISSVYSPIEDDGEFADDIVGDDDELSDEGNDDTEGDDDTPIAGFSVDEEDYLSDDNSDDDDGDDGGDDFEVSTDDDGVDDSDDSSDDGGGDEGYILIS